MIGGSANVVRRTTGNLERFVVREPNASANVKFRGSRRREEPLCPLK
jgi:hypothetical protein